MVSEHRAGMAEAGAMFEERFGNTARE